MKDTPAAIGAIFLDREGEAVELWAEHVFDIGPDGLRAIGAYEGIFLSDLNRICEKLEAGRPQRLTIDFEHVKVLSCDLKEGYYLVVVASRDANEGMLWQRMHACRDRLLPEL